MAACGGASNDSRSPPMSKGLLAAGPTVLEVKPKGFATARCPEKKNLCQRDYWHFGLQNWK